MNFKPKKFLSLLTASLLAAGGLVGLSAVPASATTPSTLSKVINFDNATNSDFTVFGSTSATVELSSGLPAGGPSTGKSLKSQKFWETWGGVNVVSLTGDELISSSDKHVKATVYTPVAGMVVKLQVGAAPANNATNLEADVTSAGGWEVMDFNFNSPSSGTYSDSITYSRATIFFNFGVGETALYTGTPAPENLNSQGGPFYLDNVTYTTSSATVITFDAATNSDFTVFGGTSATVELSSGLPAGGPSTGKTLKSQKFWETWGGVNIVSLTGSELISSADKHVKALVYTPVAGLVVKLQVGEAPASNATNLEADVTSAGGWEVMDFNFSAPSSGTYTDSVSYSRATIFFNFGVGETALYTGTPAPENLNSQGGPFYLDNVTYTSAQNQQSPTVNYDVRLTSTLKNTATDAYEWTSCGGASWCANNNYYMKMIAAGASTTLTYVVTEHGTTTPVASASVNLRINTAYSGSNATWANGGTTFGTVSTGSSSDAGTISGTTNSSGEVSFTFTNTNTNGEAARTLNNANPYPAGCDSPAGQTKAAIEPVVTAVSGATIGSQYVDVLWPHISSSTINTAIAAGSDGSNCVTPVAVRPGTKVWSPAFDVNNNGHYPHIRVEKSFLNEKLDGTWWDGVWQYRDADTRAYLKYVPVGSTFALTYTVTNEWGQPYEGAKVSLIVNANYSCSKTFFAYEGSLIGPDDCAGGGQTELPAKTADANGRVTFVLTNTNATGEAMPLDLNGAPNPATKELGTNIKPHVVGATQEGIDMLFMHFVEPAGAAKVVGVGNQSPIIGTGQASTFTFTDENGKPIAKTDVRYFINGFDSKIGFATTDSDGRVTIQSKNSAGMEGIQTVGVSLTRDGKLPLAATVTLNWAAPELAIQASAAKGAVSIKVMGAAGKTVRITVAGKTFTRSAKTANAEFSFATGAGKKSVKVVVDGKTLSKVITVTK